MADGWARIESASMEAYRDPDFSRHLAPIPPTSIQVLPAEAKINTLGYYFFPGIYGACDATYPLDARKGRALFPELAAQNK